MAWFKRKTDNISGDTQKKDLPEGMWEKCPGCGEILHKKQLENNYWVCLKCDYHFRIGSNEYIKILLDEGSFKEINKKMRSADPLQFTDSKRYTDRIDTTIKSTGLYDAVRTGIGEIEGKEVAIGIMDFKFIGGSMGSVVGEKLARLIEKAIKNKCPLIIISASGGARMMEGALSLMQLAKTSARLTQLHEAGLPYISIMTDPTTGGTTASYAMLGDFNIAEPKALIGFAGPRVIKQTIGKDLPPGFQTSEFLMEHGFVDLVISRKEMRSTLANLINLIS
ncbi:MAG: acetyl-CoA carboxylase carboxyltransferase subunit beta [Ignavibacteriales bacterium]|nr:Acetyl-coenzyme A carboxylase carboxyl transferase subunit beta [Ignavibacteriaceae bacterium]MCK6615628.1 acetyl-CoA carboxylase, carboxyltransferase subunit beta [Ignavibacteriaceae bacterium]QOJ29141.1 MAG: acetyl-CoA carboxylase carboxyltransferase subunit beta [Ignavibacteriales bacterium]